MNTQDPTPQPDAISEAAPVYYQVRSSKGGGGGLIGPDARLLLWGSYLADEDAILDSPLSALATQSAEIERLKAERDAQGELYVREVERATEVELSLRADIREWKQRHESRRAGDQVIIGGLRRERDDYHKKACEIADERDSLRAQLEAAKRDGERLTNLITRVRMYCDADILYNIEDIRNIAHMLDAAMSATTPDATGGQG